MSRTDARLTLPTGETVSLSYDLSNPENITNFIGALPLLLDLTVSEDKTTGENAAQILDAFSTALRRCPSIDGILKNQLTDTALALATSTFTDVILCNLLVLLGALSDHHTDVKGKILAQDAFLLRIRTLLERVCEGRYPTKIENRITTYITAMIATLTDADIYHEGSPKLLRLGFLPLLQALRVKGLTDEIAQRNLNIAYKNLTQTPHEGGITADASGAGAPHSDPSDSDEENARLLAGLKHRRT